MTWIVTGGAGYIGSEISHQLLAAGKNVLVIDDLSTGVSSAVPFGAKFLKLDLRDVRLMASLPRDEIFEGVIHAAGIKYAGESVKHPEEFYARNVSATLGLLDVCRELGIPRFIFSSSASVYGTPSVSPVTEEASLRPESPYGRSKLIGEWMIRDFAYAHAISYTCFRFFNVVGVGGARVIDVSPFNLFPNILRSLRQGTKFELFGTELDTPDGTCIRDYVHVSDVAGGHLAAISAWERGHALSHAYNLGLGRGISVKAILNEFEQRVGFALNVQKRPQRQGDPLSVWASNDLAIQELDWLPTETLSGMVASCL